MPIFGALLPTILGAAMLIGFTSTSKGGALVGIFLVSPSFFEIIEMINFRANTFFRRRAMVHLFQFYTLTRVVMSLVLARRVRLFVSFL